jgi:hypothetical protein
MQVAALTKYFPAAAGVIHAVKDVYFALADREGDAVHGAHQGPLPSGNRSLDP